MAGSPVAGEVHVPSATTRPPALFVGDHLALDFLNSAATPAGGRIEWLRDGADLLGWLERAGAIDAATAARFRDQGGGAAALDGVAAEARRLREWLRGFVGRHRGQRLGAGAVAELEPLNGLLARSDGYGQVAADSEGDGLRWRRERRWAPAQLLQPLAEAIGDLICTADFRLVRACEGTACTLVFLDRTKAHSRRWCSMAVCGNRAKAAAHRARAASPAVAEAAR